MQTKNISWRSATTRGRLDVPLIHRFLSEEAYWSLGIPSPTVQRAINHSLFRGYLGGRQVAFARVITDKATFGYLSDVFVLPEHRGRGTGKALMAAILAHPELQGLRRLPRHLRDAHGLYAGFGFRAAAHPGSLMENLRPGSGGVPEPGRQPISFAGSPRTPAL